MSTGSFANWNGDMFDLGPIYPFVGWEVPLVILCAICWIGWHVLQIRMESRQLENEERALRQGDRLRRVLEAEHSIERM
jgi:hypothetical protein